LPPTGEGSDSLRAQLPIRIAEQSPDQQPLGHSVDHLRRDVDDREAHALVDVVGQGSRPFFAFENPDASDNCILGKSGEGVGKSAVGVGNFEALEGIFEKLPAFRIRPASPGRNAG